MRDHPEEFLEPSGFVYHETRTGSTLVANMLAHVPSNLVLSENNVAEDPARHCHHCTDAQKVERGGGDSHGDFDLFLVFVCILFFVYMSIVFLDVFVGWCRMDVRVRWVVKFSCV